MNCFTLTVLAVVTIINAPIADALFTGTTYTPSGSSSEPMSKADAALLIGGGIGIPVFLFGSCILYFYLSDRCCRAPVEAAPRALTIEELNPGPPRGSSFTPSAQPAPETSTDVVINVSESSRTEGEESTDPI